MGILTSTWSYEGFWCTEMIEINPDFYLDVEFDNHDVLIISTEILKLQFDIDQLYKNSSLSTPKLAVHRHRVEQRQLHDNVDTQAFSTEIRPIFFNVGAAHELISPESILHASANCSMRRRIQIEN